MTAPNRLTARCLVPSSMPKSRFWRAIAVAWWLRWSRA